MKKCNQCKVKKNLNEFHEDKNKEDNRRTICKQCSLASKKKAYRTKHGLIMHIYNRQKKSSKRRKHLPPTYTRQELEDWCMSQKVFHNLYDNWKRLDYQTNYVPSVDRKDDYIGYTMDNIQLMTWEKNNEKGRNDRLSGKNNKGLKEVHQYSINGDYVASYKSIAIAERMTNISRTSIAAICRGKNNKLKIAGDYQWRYYKEEKIDYIIPEKASISQFTKDGIFIREFSSIVEASKETNINRSAITGVCRKRKRYYTAGGYIWKYTCKRKDIL